MITGYTIFGIALLFALIITVYDQIITHMKYNNQIYDAINKMRALNIDIKSVDDEYYKRNKKIDAKDLR